MPAEKSARSSQRKRLYNRMAQSSAKTYVRTAERKLKSGASEEAEGAVKQAVSALDRAARKGAIHRNNAARRKSRLQKRYNQTQGEVG